MRVTPFCIEKEQQRQQQGRTVANHDSVAPNIVEGVRGSFNVSVFSETCSLPILDYWWLSSVHGLACTRAHREHQFSNIAALFPLTRYLTAAFPAHVRSCCCCWRATSSQVPHRVPQQAYSFDHIVLQHQQRQPSINFRCSHPIRLLLFTPTSEKTTAVKWRSLGHCGAALV